MHVAGEDFYHTPEGALNARIVNQSAVRLCDEMITKHSHFGDGLLMGYGDGEVAKYYAKKFARLHILEGSESLCSLAAATLKGLDNVVIHRSFFEDFMPSEDQRVDVVVGSHVLEHVDDPRRVVVQTSSWMKEDGIAIFMVPNALSLHRRIGVKVGLLGSEYDLNDRDRAVGHQRVLDWENFQQLFDSSGFRVLEGGGYNLKLVSQRQMQDWSNDLLWAIYEVSRECPIELCSNLFVCVSATTT